MTVCFILSNICPISTSFFFISSAAFYLALKAPVSSLTCCFISSPACCCWQLSRRLSRQAFCQWGQLSPLPPPEPAIGMFLGIPPFRLCFLKRFAALRHLFLHFWVWFFWAVANHKDLPVFKRMALEFRVAQSIIYENFTLQTLTSTGRTLLYQSFGDRNVQSRKKGF